MSHTSRTRNIGGLGELVLAMAESWPHKRAYVYLKDGENESAGVTFAELAQNARRVSSLIATSTRRGERALLVYPTGLAFLEAFLGCAMCGVVSVPVYPPNSQRAATGFVGIASDATPAIGLTTLALLPGLKRLCAELPQLSQLRWVATDTLDELHPMASPANYAGGRELALLQYTSGSTGSPRGVMVSHENLLENMAMVREGFQSDASMCCVTWLPLYHDMGLIGTMLQPLFVGGSLVMMPPMTFLQRPLRWLNAISHYRADTSGGPNFAYDLCVQRVKPDDKAKLDLSSWTLAFNGGEPVRRETLDRFAEAFAPCGFRPEAFYPCYGLAEATLIVTGGERTARPTFARVGGSQLELHHVSVADIESEAARDLIGCGRPLGSTKVVIVDSDTQTLSDPNSVGEIWVSGPTVTQGYWNRPELSRSLFEAPLADRSDARYLRTGDLGFVRDGELFVTGRVKDLIIIRGRNYYPQDIECTAENADARLRKGGAAAFSIDVGGEERLVVMAELVRGVRICQEREQEIRTVEEAIRREVAAEHDLRVYAVRLIPEGHLPRTSSGKVRRHLCRSNFLNGVTTLEERSLSKAATARC
jgi:acyl-CoA synthetase (AMP-forming)/AMP-acid ligase II